MMIRPTTRPAEDQLSAFHCARTASMGSGEGMVNPMPVSGPRRTSWGPSAVRVRHPDRTVVPRVRATTRELAARVRATTRELAARSASRSSSAWLPAVIRRRARRNWIPSRRSDTT